MSVVALFVIIFVAELYGCFVAPNMTVAAGGAPSAVAHGYCRDLHDFKDVLEPFASAMFTALGAAVAFYFAERKR